MKKITLLSLLCALFMAPAVATAQEVTYVEDPAQGYLLNRMKDNWFIQAEGGVGMMMSKWDKHEKFGKRLGVKANLFIGKWFSPLWGARVGFDFARMNGATEAGNYAALGYYKAIDSKWNKQQFNNIGGAGDLMFNLTNWICGYKPGRFYNAVLYAGGTFHWVYTRDYTTGDPTGPRTGKWKYGAGDDTEHCRNYSVQAGLMNYFSVLKRLDILLDLRFDLVQEHVDGAGMGYRTWNEYPSVQIGLNYKFGKYEWNAPVTAVCPTWKYTDAEGDALVARLNDANRKIADLEDQLRKCLEKKPEAAPAVDDAPLATVYFPINRTQVLGVQRNVVEAVAEVMKNENRDYLLTGWADNYTGNDKINVRLRKGRVATVKSELVKRGVEDGRLETQINNGNLTNYGPKCASLDRAVTIHRK